MTWLLWRHKTNCIYMQLVDVLEKWFVACWYGCLGCSIRKCHRICICMLISFHAVTSWSWRPVKIKQISFYSSELVDALQLSNIFAFLVNWQIRVESILLLLQFHMMAWRYNVTSWRNVVTCWRSSCKNSIDDFLIPTTQITMEFK